MIPKKCSTSSGAVLEYSGMHLMTTTVSDSNIEGFRLTS